LWLAVAWWTGSTFIGYFAPIRELGHQLFALQLGGWQWFVNVQSASGLASRRCHQWQRCPMSAGPRICAGCGRVGTAGRRWRW
ncbi:hypothetical protein L546_0421, partial [Bordetella pertussis H897]